MGSDLYMESHNFRPRQSYAIKNRAGRWEIYRDYFYDGFRKERATHKDTPEVRRLLHHLGIATLRKHPDGQG